MANEANSMIAEGQSKIFTVSVANYSGSKTIGSFKEQRRKKNVCSCKRYTF